MSRRPALVLAGHGSQRHADSAAPLFAHADHVRTSGAFEEVHAAFWKEEPALRRVAETLRRPAAVVVPVLTSEGYFADEVFPRELGVEDPDARPSDVDLAYADPVGTHPALADVVVDRVESARTGPAGEVGVVLVGHGTERNPRSARATREHADRVRERADYAEVEPLFLDEPPFVADLLDHLGASEVVVVPLFVADGHHTTRDIPDAFGHPGIGETVPIDGRTVHYTGAVGAEPTLADVIVERAEEACEERGWTDADNPPSGAREPVTADRDGPASGADEAFRDLVDAGPDAVEWGELSIGAAADGYGLRNRRDVDQAQSGLNAIEDPEALRDRVRADDRGRYRPLSGAETLPTGWVLGGLDDEELVRAVEYVYPGSVARWYLDRTDELSTTAFEATVERQTGLYADLDELDPAERVAAVEAVCGDCVRERRWPVTADEAAEADVSGSADPADDAIPCPEACPFFLSAAHAFRDVHPDGTATEDPAVAPGAFESPGNRHRVRYARALAENTETASPAPPDGGNR